MENIGQAVTRINPDQTEQTKQSEITFRSTEKVFAFVWRGLQAARFISKDDHVGGTDYNYWRHQLRDLTDDELQAGHKACKGFSGVMTLSAFRDLCLQATKQEPSYKPFKALPVKRMTVDKARDKFDQMYLENPDLCPEVHRERLGL